MGKFRIPKCFICSQTGKEYILYSRMTNSRRKNKHPKRAENVKTVVVASGEKREEEGEGDDDVERLLEDAHVRAV